MRILNAKWIGLTGMLVMLPLLMPYQAFASSTDGIYLSVKAEPTVTGYSPALVTVKLHNPTENDFTLTGQLSPSEISWADMNRDGVVNQADIQSLRESIDQVNRWDVNGDERFTSLDLLFAQNINLDVTGDGVFNEQDQTFLGALVQIAIQIDLNRDGRANDADVDYIKTIMAYVQQGGRMVLKLYFQQGNNLPTQLTLYPAGTPISGHSDMLLGVTTVKLPAGTWTARAVLSGAFLRDVSSGWVTADMLSSAVDTLRTTG